MTVCVIDGRQMDRRQIERGQGGFTLLELLLVIVILSLVVVMLTGGVRFASRAWATQERLIDQQGDASAVQTVLRQLITAGHDFQGDSGSLRFVGPLPRALRRGGLFDNELTVEDDRLVFKWRPHVTSTGPKPDPDQTDLMNNVASIELGYYFGNDKEAPSWHTASDSSVAPALILVRVARATGKAWPPLVVAPMIDAPPAAAAASPSASGAAAPPSASQTPQN